MLVFQTFQFSHSLFKNVDRFYFNHVFDNSNHLFCFAAAKQLLYSTWIVVCFICEWSLTCVLLTHKHILISTTYTCINLLFYTKYTQILSVYYLRKRIRFPNVAYLRFISFRFSHTVVILDFIFKLFVFSFLNNKE